MNGVKSEYWDQLKEKNYDVRINNNYIIILQSLRSCILRRKCLWQFYNYWWIPNKKTYDLGFYLNK